MNDPTTQMGLQLGKNAFDIGQNYAEQSVRSHYPRLASEANALSTDPLPLCSSKFCL